MTKDINDFVNIFRQKNGEIRIKHDISNEVNIYKFLNELGFRKSKLDNKRIYFRRQENKVIPSSILLFKTTFYEFLERGALINIPNDLDRSEILEWYFSANPIKENGLFDHYLADTLTEAEAHNFRLLTNHSYKHSYEIKLLLSKFNEWSFSKALDSVGAFCKDNPLYYKRIDGNKFLVFNHYNSTEKDIDGFDCWIATYTTERHIGNIKPITLEDLRLSFHLDRDLELIRDYVL